MFSTAELSCRAATGSECVLFSSSRREVFGGASEGVEMPEAVQAGWDGGKTESVKSLHLLSPAPALGYGLKSLANL